MAVGAAYLANRKCIVQKLTAIESLAGVDVLCSDKTGTLTANRLSLNEPYVAEGVDKNWLMCVAVLASSHNIKMLDPIDKVTILSLKSVYPDFFATACIGLDHTPNENIFRLSDGPGNTPGWVENEQIRPIRPRLETYNGGRRERRQTLHVR